MCNHQKYNQNQSHKAHTKDHKSHSMVVQVIKMIFPNTKQNQKQIIKKCHLITELLRSNFKVQLHIINNLKVINLEIHKMIYLNPDQTVLWRNYISHQLTILTIKIIYTMIQKKKSLYDYDNFINKLIYVKFLINFIIAYF